MCPEEVVKSSPRLLPLLRQNYWEQEEPIQDEDFRALIRRERITLPDSSSEIFSDSTSIVSHQDHSYKHFPEEENFTEHQQVAAEPATKDQEHPEEKKRSTKQDRQKSNAKIQEKIKQKIKDKGKIYGRCKQVSKRRNL